MSMFLFTNTDQIFRNLQLKQGERKKLRQQKGITMNALMQVERWQTGVSNLGKPTQNGLQVNEDTLRE